MVRIEATVEVDEHRHACRLDRAHADVGPRHIEIDRLLAQHRFLRRERTHDEVRMGTGRRGDQYRVHLRIGQGDVGIGDGAGPVRVGQRPRPVQVEIDDGAQGQLGMRGDVRSMDPGDPPGAEQTEVDHGAACHPGVAATRQIMRAGAH
jgi:hypothetical protein